MNESVRKKDGHLQVSYTASNILSINPSVFWPHSVSQLIGQLSINHVILDKKLSSLRGKDVFCDKPIECICLWKNFCDTKKNLYSDKSTIKYVSDLPPTQLPSSKPPSCQFPPPHASLHSQVNTNLPRGLTSTRLETSSKRS